jgi:hypothetical protein
MRYLYGPPFGTDREEWGDISLLTTEMLFKIGCPPYVGQGFGVGPLPRLGRRRTYAAASGQDNYLDPLHSRRPP